MKKSIFVLIFLIVISSVYSQGTDINVGVNVVSKNISDDSGKSINQENENNSLENFKSEGESINQENEFEKSENQNEINALNEEEIEGLFAVKSNNYLFIFPIFILGIILVLIIMIGLTKRKEKILEKKIHENSKPKKKARK